MMKKIKVALGLSGGVDSAVSAYLLKSYGYDVHCVYLNCFDSDIPGCRGDNDRKDALAVAMHLGLPFQVLDFRLQYKAAVIDYFKKEYLLGRTPNPDVVCNRDIKFGLFMDWAVKAGFDYVATGHYAKIVHRDPNNPNRHPNCPNSEHSDEFVDLDRVVLLQPKDLRKDQTYFLWAVPREKFKRVLFPLGNLLKSEVREIAKDAGLGVADKKDSTGICFVGEVRVEDFLKKLGVKEKRGEVVVREKMVKMVEMVKDGNNLNNLNPPNHYRYRVIGFHRGVWFYTIGQRHGFEITNWPPVSLSLRGASRRATWQSSEAIRDKPVFYVIEKDIKKNRLIVGFGAETYRDQFTVSQVNWLAELPITNYQLPIAVRIRHGGGLIPCSVISSPLSVVGNKSSGFQSAGSEQNNRKQANQNPTRLAEAPAKRATENRKPITVFLSEPQRGIAAGQSAVFYSKNGIVLGGGVIQ